ncbi:DNA polymerase I [Patescibacteria group bacterium]|nr:DNA polymerase I [Patescibacteria group bacterium]MBU4512232.1 DNA polymerase I [Patescibacteria group bacterium]MCG2692650.1 DNA polymerase I [Candidatus Parcubacteria bacterium]
MSKKPKFIIIDGNALLHRAWHALPPLTTNKGQIVSGVYGFTAIFLKVLKELEPDYIAVTFDRREKTFRHKEFKEYKAKRIKQPDELYEQIPILKNLLSTFRVKIYEKAGFEADDVIGTLAKKAGDNIKTIIVTGDLDTLQLIDESTEVYTLKKGISDTFIYDVSAVKARYGLTPEQMIDYKALRGDPSDNIPGVRGIGEKGAADLIKEFKTLEGIYNDIGKVKKERAKNLLVEHKKDALLSKKLVTIVDDLNIDFKLEDCRLKSFDQQAVFKIFQELNFKSLLNRLPRVDNVGVDCNQPLQDDGQQQKSEQVSLFGKSAVKKEIPYNKNYHLIDNKKDFDDFIEKLKKQKIFALDTETTDYDPLKAKLLGISFCWEDGKAYYIDVGSVGVDCNQPLRGILGNIQIQKFGQNIKYDLKVLHQAGINLEGICFDTMIASYLLNPGTRGHGLDNLAFVEFGHQMITMEDLIGKGRDKIGIDEVTTGDLAQYSCEDADYTWRLKERLEKRLKENKNLELLLRIEIPLVSVLAEMEENGVKIDDKFLGKMSVSVQRKINALELKIYKLAGKKFNVRSPLQLKEILFEKLKISPLGLGKTKTGVSTAAGELDKLKGKHKIIDLIIDHRELSKLQSTYIEALPKLINPKTGRVHTSYNQTITATGRLSSSDPNLQNIPIRTSLGREIRKAFVAPAGYKILTADYSQIELRIVASLANDPVMISLFKGHQDIHTATASFIHDVPEEQVDKQLRRTAKEINFGVLYGMGVSGIASRTGLPRAQAQEFLDKYFGRFKAVQKYLMQSVERGREQGYVETLFGRRRYLPDLNSGVQQIRAVAERMALNQPIQGTAADLMKIAMINLSQKLSKHNSDEVTMLLQVHDELVFEVKSDSTEKIAKIIKHEMENVYTLRVPIEAEIEAGQNWGELKPLNIK